MSSYDFSLNNYNQDWLLWVNKGYVDEIVLQAYRPNVNQFSQAIATSKINYIAHKVPVGIGIYAGSPVKLLTPKEIQNQIEITEKLGYGFSIFCWEYRILSSFFH